jgi:NADH-quinone oxidoreductase subunit A
MPDNYFARYLPLLIHVVVVGAIACTMVILSTLIGQRRYSRAKFQPYECGMTPVGDARERFPVKFYLVAMLFILFDVEAVFLYPWAIIFKELKMFGFWEMLVYIGIVLVGFFYIWKKGVLDWTGYVRTGAFLASTPGLRRQPAETAISGSSEVVAVGMNRSDS